MDGNIVICFHSSSLSCFVEYRKDIPFLIVRSSGQQKIHEPVYKGIQHTHITCFHIVIVDCSLVYFTKQTISIFPKLVTEMAFYVDGVSGPCLELRFFIAKKQIDSLYTFWSLNIILFFSHQSICDAIIFKGPCVQSLAYLNGLLFN